MMHAQRTASRRNSACSQLSAFVGSNMLQGQPPPAVLAWLENHEEFLRLRESGVLAAMIRQHQEQEQERASARSALFEPRAGGQGGVIASML